MTYLRSGAGGEGGGELTIGARDARGGPLVERPLLLEGGDSLEAYVPLPLAAPSSLSEGQWTVELTVRDRGREIEQALVRVGIGDVESAAVFRVVIPEPDRQNAAEAADVAASSEEMAKAFGQPVSVMHLSLRAILDDSPLLFASSDAILLTPALQAEISEARAAALINAGARLIVISETAPGGESFTAGMGSRAIHRYRAGGAARDVDQPFTAVAPASGH